MTHPVRTAAVALIVLVGLLAGCSSSSSGGDAPSGIPSTLGPDSTVPESNGFTCEDPKGDVIDSARQTEMLTEPAGIDLVTAEAHVDGDALAVTYTTAGPISLAPEPFFAMLQGDLASPAFTWEIRAQLNSQGRWELVLTDFEPLAQAGGTARTTGLSAPVTVSGNQLSYRVPLANLPPIVAVQWAFGSSSTQTDRSVRIDDCSSLTSGTTTTTSAPAAGN